MNIKNIIFDFGGVVMDWDPRYFFRDYFNDDEKMEYFLGNIATNEWNAEQDRGRSVAEANALLISKHPEWEKEILAYYENWHIMLRSDIPENVSVLQRLNPNSAIEKKEYFSILISNCVAVEKNKR